MKATEVRAMSVEQLNEKLVSLKKDLFFLLVGFLLWYMLELLISSMLSGVLGLVFQMLAGLAISVYMSCSIAVFYLFLESGEKTPKEPEPEELN